MHFQLLSVRRCSQGHGSAGENEGGKQDYPHVGLWEMTGNSCLLSTENMDQFSLDNPSQNACSPPSPWDAGGQ